ncbi:putative two component response regulator [Ameyamaea chiangmaiensis NBRC 103196]|uniref:Response regulator n=1 Tax=Ameyamaea chiangmaiensis TaxID=442969 RepID=A0A850PKC7_9PROT|nr:response regulator [Ameyamaea chiangmaiensis]MBS4074448.1 response regulator [Ameyamaea chiangmaiensis]NVN41761.1 response regulator [Ameyamaea chiangmaiensis]GBQ72076.1 putative two component response regulator [Ameyamaea chiangmaiensis NBRC 103196]
MPEQGEQAFMRHGTVVAVEDDPLLRLDVSCELRQSGYDVIEFESADDAVVSLQDPGLVVRAVVTDVNIPGQHDGVALADHIRHHRRGTPVIFTTGAPDRVREQGRPHPDERMLPKPCAAQDIVAELHGLGVAPTAAS